MSSAAWATPASSVGISLPKVGKRPRPSLFGDVVLVAFLLVQCFDSAKVTAAFLGICLHLRQVHLAVALLTGFYAAAALAPWTLILFF
jgi:hypothetical protein